MELELQHKVVEGFCPVYHAVLGQEETLESIVPDSFPDVARIVSAAGKVFLKEKIAGEGTLKLTGTIDVTVLYISEGDGMTRALDVTLPFQCTKDCPLIHEDMFIHGNVTVASSDARIMNPRKILVRSSLLCSVLAYGKERLELTCDVTDCQESCIEKQLTQQKNFHIAEVVEKTFLFSDVLRQAASKPAMEELMLFYAELGGIDGKVIGKKLVCKGEVALSVLYRSGTDMVPARFELPYSQIIDLKNATEEGVVELAFALKNVDCRLREGELEVTVEALLQGAIWTQQQVTLMSDMYCTSCALDVERNICTLCSMAEQGVRREAARQFCPSGIPGKQVLNCRASVESIAEERGETDYRCTAQVNVDVLYLSEDDALCGVNYVIPVNCNVAAQEAGNCRWMCRPTGEISAVPVTGGLEVRIEVEFRWITTQEKKVLCVAAVKHDAEKTIDVVRPSVVIRLVGEHESLWEIAKSCGSTVRDICNANNLPSDAVPKGTALLIPVKRT